MRDKDERRLQRQIDMLARPFPALRGPARALRGRGWAIVRVPMAIALILGGILSILPFLGAWMLPLGVLLLAVDVPMLRRPASAAVIHVRRWLSLRLRRFKK